MSDLSTLSTSSERKLGVASTALLNFMTAFLRLLLSVLLARLLGAEGRGEIAIFVVAAELLSRLLGAGLAIPLAQRAKLDTEPAITRVSSFAALAWLVPSGLAGLLIVTYLSDSLDAALAIGIAVLVFCQVNNALIRQILVGLGRLREAVGIQLLVVSTTLLAVSLQWVLGIVGATSATLAYAGGAFLGWIVSIVVLGRNYRGEPFLPAQRPSPSDISGAFRAFPFTFLQYVNGALDIVVIGVVAGPAEAGLYAVALTSVRPLLVIANTIGLVGFANGTDPEIGDDSKVPVRAVLARSIPLGMLWLPVAFLGLPIVFGDEFQPARTAAAVLCLSSGVNIAYGYLSQKCVARGGAVSVSKAEAVAAVVTVVGLGLSSLVNELGASIAAVVTLLAYSSKLFVLTRSR